MNPPKNKKGVIVLWNLVFNGYLGFSIMRLLCIFVIEEITFLTMDQKRALFVGRVRYWGLVFGWNGSCIACFM
uniref:Photosystem I assembly protein Ycf4 n=3 Tax=Lathyrus TaxID=3853 RepID=A0A7R6TMN3_9FABA|nr:photosystem I assembly protein Ycf4 [Lathyrus alamutensis]BBU53518.1 photosystem I assembly protein Ycf4 [Lathyrus armenus]BBU53519.1 photosystem I assembly protein Ycf4 [Lathyrus boissieri]